MEEDWDLHAVVRSCSSAAGKNPGDLEQDCSFTRLKDPSEPPRESSSVQVELHQLWKPLFKKQQIPPVSPLSVLQDLPSEPKQQQQQQQLFSFVSGSKRSTTSQQQNPRSKKRKNHSKKVCHVPAESLSSDTWSWRKYGQKPIKGSPYPRGYYRCSTLKGCMARKQVERNRSDPGMFIVTYTGDHTHPMPTHRNSLAGSTRPKPASDEPKEKMDDDDEDDDFFAGLEGFAGEENLQFPWVAAGGG